MNLSRQCHVCDSYASLPIVLVDRALHITTDNQDNASHVLRYVREGGFGRSNAALQQMISVWFPQLTVPTNRRLVWPVPVPDNVIERRLAMLVSQGPRRSTTERSGTSYETGEMQDKQRLLKGD